MFETLGYNSWMSGVLVTVRRSDPSGFIEQISQFESIYDSKKILVSAFAQEATKQIWTKLMPKGKVRHRRDGIENITCLAISGGENGR